MIGGLIIWKYQCHSGICFLSGLQDFWSQQCQCMLPLHNSNAGPTFDEASALRWILFDSPRLLPGGTEVLHKASLWRWQQVHTVCVDILRFNVAAIISLIPGWNGLFENSGWVKMWWNKIIFLCVSIKGSASSLKKISAVLAALGQPNTAVAEVAGKK